MPGTLAIASAFFTPLDGFQRHDENQVIVGYLQVVHALGNPRAKDGSRLASALAAPAERRKVCPLHHFLRFFYGVDRRLNQNHGAAVERMLISRSPCARRRLVFMVARLLELIGAPMTSPPASIYSLTGSR